MEQSFKIVLLIVVGILLYKMLCDDEHYQSMPYHNDGALELSNNSDDNTSAQSESVSNDPSNNSSSDDSSMSIIESRMRGRNNAGDNTYKSSSLVSQERKLDNIDSNYYNVPDITQNNNDRYTGMSESDDDVASINVGNNKETEADKYDLNAFLPQEEEKDWFETIETVNVKNSHLINTYKPIGVNTIGTSLKNASYDLRGTGDAICPKYTVAPWLQSSTEPDRTSKSLC